uniref:Rhodanese domain-containing protein n=1 Tax=Xiphophorus couchianus TaxID=32473 RepID=A0A3B5KX51_9TELE
MTLTAMDIKRLASLIQRGTGRLLVIDSRTFSEYNASHVQGSVNVCYSKLVKRRLQQDKVSVTELLHCTAQEVVVYDQSSKERGHLSKDGFVHILMGKLEGTFHKVSLLTGKQDHLRYCSLLSKYSLLFVRVGRNGPTLYINIYKVVLSATHTSSSLSPLLILAFFFLTSVRKKKESRTFFISAAASLLFP